MTVSFAPKLLSVVELSHHYGVSRQTLYNWRDRGCPIGQGIEAIDAWKADHPTETKSADSQDLLAAKVRDTNAAADLKELKRSLAAKELMYRDDVERDVAEAFTWVKSQLEDIPAQLEREIPPDLRPSLTPRLEEVIRQALTRLAQGPGDVDSLSMEAAVLAEAERIRQRRSQQS